MSTEYRLAGELVVSQKCPSEGELWFSYDSAGNAIAITKSGVSYGYVRNLQNDIIALVDGEGNTVVNYEYDSWGKVLSSTGSLKDTVGAWNPFCYRGYYYDNNLYAYCDENPVMRMDFGGNIWIATVAIGVVTQYAIDVLGNVISGRRGFDILKPTSTIGEYIAAGTTALISGSGIGASFVRNSIAEGIVSIERHIKGTSNSVLQSTGRVILGTVIDSGVEKVINESCEVSKIGQ